MTSAIEAAMTALVQSAPARDRATVQQLVADLTADGRPLARSIARVLELLDAGQIDPAIALPHLAMACSTLCDPRLGEREREAARYEIETLLPLPASAPRPPPLGAPDVPLISLSRGSRSRT